MAGYLMETSAASEFHAVRSEFVSYCTDQGIEKALADDTVRVLPRFAEDFPGKGPDSYKFPRCLYMVGHLHVFYNALEEACKHLTCDDWYLDCLSTLVNCLSLPWIRQKFMATCVHGLACCSNFKSFPVTQTNWRWETLSLATQRVAGVWDDLVEHWSLEAMQSSDSGSTKPSGQLKDVTAVLKQPTLAVSCC